MLRRFAQESITDDVMCSSGERESQSTSCRRRMFPRCEIVRALFVFRRFWSLTCFCSLVESFYNTEISEMPLNVAESVSSLLSIACMSLTNSFQSHLSGFESTLSLFRVEDRAGVIMGGSIGVRSDITNLICCKTKMLDLVRLSSISPPRRP